MSSVIVAIGGPYSMTYNSLTSGHTEEGFRIEEDLLTEEVRGDAHGDTLVDEFYRGQNVSMRFMAIEWGAAGLATMMQPHSSTPGTRGTGGIISRLMEALAQQIVLTALSGTPAAAAPASLTATKAVRTGKTGYALTSKHRKVDLTMRFYPVVASSVLSHYTTT
jgi:hypothetical protein